jgi:hypothetical protein
VPGAPEGWATGVGWSQAHANIRFFAPVESYAELDGALAEVMLAPNALDGSAAIRAYADRLPAVCAVDEAEGVLGDAEMYMVGSTLMVKPGYGEVLVPNIARLVAVDLRGLPAVAGLDEVLARSIAPAVLTPIPRLPARVRSHFGMTDEIGAATLFEGEIVEVERAPIEGSGLRDLPIVLLTDDQLAPAAAAFAIDLRVAQRGWIAGEDIPTRVAEARFSAIGDAGVFFRQMDLVTPADCDTDLCMPVPSLDRRLPDVIRADWRLAEPQLFATTALERQLPEPYVMDEEATRQPLGVIDPSSSFYFPEGNLGTGRAALLIAHGALDLFYPNFDVVGDRIDARLVETLEAVQGLNQFTGRPMWHLLRRFGEAVEDGQMYVSTPHASAGIVAARFDHIDGEPVVTQSLAPELVVGDALVAWDGVPIAQVYAKERLRTSAATAQYQDVLISRHLRWLDGPVALTLRSPDGGLRTEVVSPAPAASFAELPMASTRSSGWLSDMGAADVFYLNLDEAVTGSDKEALAAIDEGLGAEAMVVDLRGSLAVNPYVVTRRLTPNDLRTPRYGVPTWTGTERDVAWMQFTIRADDDASFDGPIVLLVGPQTVATAEEFAMIITRATRTTIVGRATAGTVGTPTGAGLPGGAKLGFTGVEVQWPEGGAFHGVGITPQLEVVPSAVGIQMGVDEVLEAAVSALNDV